LRCITPPSPLCAQVDAFQANEVNCTVLFGGTDKIATPTQEEICRDLEASDDKVHGAT